MFEDINGIKLGYTNFTLLFRTLIWQVMDKQVFTYFLCTKTAAQL